MNPHNTSTCAEKSPYLAPKRGQGWKLVITNKKITWKKTASLGFGLRETQLNLLLTVSTNRKQ
jgi:hypothetical protein